MLDPTSEPLPSRALPLSEEEAAAAQKYEAWLGRQEDVYNEARFDAWEESQAELDEEDEEEERQEREFDAWLASLEAQHNEALFDAWESSGQEEVM